MKLGRIIVLFGLGLATSGGQSPRSVLSGLPVTSRNCPEGGPRAPQIVQSGDSVFLRRGVCFGTCPAYDVTIHDDGRVEWDGRKFVETVGNATSNVSPNEARTLIQKFLAPEVYALCGRYEKKVSDVPTFTVEIKTSEGMKRIVDYAESTPDWFHVLRDEIDVVANTHQWRHGDGKEGLGFLPWESLPKTGVTELMQAAKWQGPDKVRRLIMAGADVNARDSSGWTALMYAAARYAQEAATAELLQAGADPRSVSSNGDTLLMVRALRGEYDTRFVQAGVDLNAQNLDGMTMLMVLASRRNAAATKAAIEAGAKIDLRDKDGHTAYDYLMARDCAAPLVRGDQVFRQLCLPLRGADVELGRLLQVGSSPIQAR